MDVAITYHWQSLSALDAPTDDPIPRAYSNDIACLVEPVRETIKDKLLLPRPLHQDWSKLIDRVRHVASHAREVEIQIEEQEQRVQDVLERVREDIQNAALRVKNAEAQTADIQSRFDALVKVTDEKVKAAEERANLAEEWLARVSNVISSEFDVDIVAEN